MTTRPLSCQSHSGPGLTPPPIQGLFKEKVKCFSISADKSGAISMRGDEGNDGRWLRLVCRIRVVRPRALPSTFARSFARANPWRYWVRRKGWRGGFVILRPNHATYCSNPEINLRSLLPLFLSFFHFQFITFRPTPSSSSSLGASSSCVPNVTTRKSRGMMMLRSPKFGFNIPHTLPDGPSPSLSFIGCIR